MWLELQLAQVNLYTRKDFKSSRNLYEKYILILKKVKTSLMLNFSLQNCLESFESFIFFMVRNSADKWRFKIMNVLNVFGLIAVSRNLSSGFFLITVD